jgi:hypothetical protein
MLAHVAERHGLDFAAVSIVSAARITHGNLPTFVSRVLDFQPSKASPRPVARIPPLGHDAFQPERACMAEDGLTIAPLGAR